MCADESEWNENIFTSENEAAPKLFRFTKTSPNLQYGLEINYEIYSTDNTAKEKQKPRVKKIRISYGKYHHKSWEINATTFQKT